MFAKIRKWHRVTFDSRAGLHKTRCGLWARRDTETVTGIPFGEDTCESCLRLIVKDEENG